MTERDRRRVVVRGLPGQIGSAGAHVVVAATTLVLVLLAALGVGGA